MSRELPSEAASLLNDASPPVARALLIALAALLATAFGWTAWAEVEELVRAQGQVIPAGHTKLVNHPEGGRVAELLVHEGQRVAADTPLLRLDAAIAERTLAETRARYEVVAIAAARLEAEADERPLVPTPELAAARPDLLRSEARLLEARRAARRDEIAALDQLVATRAAELATAETERARLRRGAALLREQHAALRELAERGLYPRLKLQASAKELADAEGAAARAAATLEAVRSALAEGQARRAAVASERRRALLAELAEARADAARLAEQLAAQTARRNGLELRAPVAGIVQDIKLTGAGQSIAANEPILRIVPSDAGLVIEARIANADIGRLAIGDSARVKVQAYDYLRYGTLAGTVRHIAADASVRVAGEEAGYLVTVVTGRTHLGAAPGEQDVLPGMLAEIEIEVGERTILSYLTDRLRRVGDGAFRDG